eukprot:SAG22_NODE_99_length_20560_cov_128.669029_28_plen_124_part_00
MLMCAISFCVLRVLIAGAAGFVGTWQIEDQETWVQAVSGVMNVSQADLPVMPMTGSAGCESPQMASMTQAARAVAEDFAYASFLLAAGTRTQLFGKENYSFFSFLIHFPIHQCKTDPDRIVKS